MIPARAQARDDAEPLDADLPQLHVTVSRRVIEQIDRASPGGLPAAEGRAATLDDPPVE